MVIGCKRNGAPLLLDFKKKVYFGLDKEDFYFPFGFDLSGLCSVIGEYRIFDRDISHF